MGPLIDKADSASEEINKAVERVFQRNNLIRDCIDRHTDALIGKLPTWFFKDSNGERVALEPDEDTGEVPDSPASQADKLIQRWLDRVLNLATAQDSDLDNAFTEAAKNAAVTNMGYLRLWSPKRFRDALDPVQRVAIHCPSNDAVEYIYDDDRFLERINYHYTVDDKQFIESQTIDPETNETVFEIQDDRGNVLKDTETGEDQIFRMALGGRYTIQRIQAPSLITESARDAQNAINFVLTMMVRNLEQAGFLERIILGAMPPGREEYVDGEKKFIPDTKFRIGAGQTTFLQGTPVMDEEGSVKGYGTPSVNYREPVDIETFERSHKVETAILYTQMGQGHLVAADLNMSGIARVQARQDFDRKLEKHRNTVQSAIGGIMGAALLMMVDDPTPYLSLDVAVQLRLSTSKPLPEELDQNRQDYVAKLRSQSTAMSAAGIEDTDAERALIREEQMENNALTTATTLLSLGAQDADSAIAMLDAAGAVPRGTRSTVDPNIPLNPSNDDTTTAGTN
ncbi:hypothetical protein AVDCRST_MAG94-5106 [uncultured Leptolyngbya sp.]|uniref:Uncharacterized protein n=1 Tax=uncultured Leptolyngbya sp. TaxID=332963 RepID=A0A6J4NDM3_9CYAN|nr:hypothetical protein AVDCRST_MAG94-5106 [uncultured Leptolyngbya sp.]